MQVGLKNTFADAASLEAPDSAGAQILLFDQRQGALQKIYTKQAGRCH